MHGRVAVGMVLAAADDVTMQFVVATTLIL